MIVVKQMPICEKISTFKSNIGCLLNILICTGPFTICGVLLEKLGTAYKVIFPVSPKSHPSHRILECHPSLTESKEGAGIVKPGKGGLGGGRCRSLGGVARKVVTAALGAGQAPEVARSRESKEEMGKMCQSF